MNEETIRQALKLTTQTELGMQMSNLYILVFRDGEYIKIGKADDIHARIAVLQRVWGPVDYKASYYLHAPLNASLYTQVDPEMMQNM